MTKTFKPLLAEDFIEDKLIFPGYVSPKIDGIRAFEKGGVLMSRSMKPIPNPHVQALFAKYEHLDGELACGDPWSPTLMQDTYSGVMKKTGTPDVKWYIFDYIENETLPFEERYAAAEFGVKTANDPNVIIVPHYLVNNLDELLAREAEFLEMGYEGAMYRRKDGVYKQGRSTVKEGILLKIKRFKDAECRIIGFEEQMFNGNEATKDELGRTKRSSAKAGLSGKGTLGAFEVVGINGIFEGIDFSIGIGVGLDTKLRQEVWDNREQYLGKIITFRYFPIGVKDRPRFPKFHAFRAPEDMSK